MFRYRKILVPLDGSDLSERAVAPALTLADAMDAQLLLLRVVTPIPPAMDPQVYDQMSRQMEDEATAYLREWRSRLRQRHEDVVVAVRRGGAAETIIRTAQDESCELIVISSHGRSGPGRWVYGSVAEKVMHSDCCPTLIIRAQVDADLFSQRHILTPLDGSELAERALPPARAIAAAAGGRLTLLRVGEVAHLTLETKTIRQQSDYLEENERVEAEAYLTQVDVGDLPPERVARRFARGPVADVIIDYAAHQGVDLIVISSHGRSGVQRWIHGSVAEKVLRGAHCATLIIRKP